MLINILEKMKIINFNKKCNIDINIICNFKYLNNGCK